MDQELTLRQVSSILRVDDNTLRLWEKEFQEYLNNTAPAPGRRTYTQAQLETFSQIKELLQTELYTVQGARRRLELDRTLASALGVEQNFKNTVFFMFSAIMEELRRAREESRNLVERVQMLRAEKESIENRLLAEQNKSLVEFIKERLLIHKGAGLSG